jgi:hypothetical protein
MNWYGEIDAYYAGCRAQAKADREAVERIIDGYRFEGYGPIREVLDKMRAALAAAEIKEVK